MVETQKKYPMWDTIIGYVDRMADVFDSMMQAEDMGEQVINPIFLRILSTYLKGLYKAEAENKTKILYNFCR